MPVSTSAYNLARFDLVSIRLVVDCARLGSLSAAADQSHLALAAASRRVRELEAAVGQLLFERHGRGLRSTAAGRVFVRHALSMLQALEQLGGELRDLNQGIARRIRLSASTASITQFLAPLRARIQPVTAIWLSVTSTDALWSHLKRNRPSESVARLIAGISTCRTGLSPQAPQPPTTICLNPQLSETTGSMEATTILTRGVS